MYISFNKRQHSYNIIKINECQKKIHVFAKQAQAIASRLSSGWSMLEVLRDLSI